jgi:protein-tyrosine phosphatase
MPAYVDLHLHLLPAVDDGARTVEDALTMARALIQVGFTQAAPSPHHRPQYASYDRQRCAQVRGELQGSLQAAGLALELHENAENDFLDDAFVGELGTARARCVGQGKAMLVEAPYVGPLPSLLELLFKMRLKGHLPVIAHPERCPEFERPGRAAEAVAQGALLQLDLGSLTGRYGKAAQRLARDFLSRGLYALAASDLHSPVNAEAWLSHALQTLTREVGAGGVTSLLETTPRRLLMGQVEGEAR